MFGTNVMETLIAFVVIAAATVPYILFVKTLYNTLLLCSPECRTLSPKLVWLLLFPVFNLFWNFVVVSRLTRSLQNEFAKRNHDEDMRFARGAGFVLGILSIVYTLVGREWQMTAGIAMLICLLVYWRMIERCAERLQEDG